MKKYLSIVCLLVSSTALASPGRNANDDLGFFVRIRGNQARAVIHRADAPYRSDIGTTNFSEECRIGNGRTFPDILCVLEVNEDDLHYGRINLEYQIPGTCSFARINPYSFYAYEAGQGPATSTREILDTGEIVDGVNSRAGVPYCAYDHTSENGPNCCVGTYQEQTLEHFADGSSVHTQTKRSWGGKVANCLSGPAMQTQAKNAYGFPQASINYISGSGILDTLPLDFTQNYRSNVFWANFYQPSDHSFGLPPGLRKPNISSGLSFLPQDTYEFSCVDGGRELKQRIRILVREWNGPIVEGGTPNLGGSSLYKDWKDFGESFPGAEL